MPITKSKIRSSYPLPAYNYRVTFYGSEFILGAAGTTTLGFSEVSGLSVQYEHAVYRHGLSFLSGITIVRGQADPVKVTMKRGVFANNTGDFFYNWLGSEDKFTLLKSRTKDITIDLCDETGAALMRWLVKDAMPIRMDMPSFNADNNEVAIETLEVVAHSLKANYSL